MEQLISTSYAIDNFPMFCQPRAIDSHKGTFGTLGIIGSSEGMSGAIILAGMSALKSGCGKVILGFNQQILPISYISDTPELMLTTANLLFENSNINSWIIGPGLGQSAMSIQCVKNGLLMLTNKTSMVWDADGLNTIAMLKENVILNEHCVITPHPREAARLLEIDINEIQHDRINAAMCLARKYQCWVVLKGHQTVISSPDECIWINHTGNSGLATAGSGDVLTGMIGSLAAQGLAFEEAIRAGVWLHGAAADLRVKQGIGPIGLTAHEVIDAARQIRNNVVKIAHPQSSILY